MPYNPVRITEALALALFFSVSISAFADAEESRTGGLPSYEISDFRGRRISRLSLAGPGADMVEDIAGGLYARSKGASLYEQKVDEDMDRVRLYLARRGYPWSSVIPGVRPSGDRGVALQLEIFPGPPVRIVSFDVDGMPEGLDPRAYGVSPPSPGDIFTENAVEAYRESAEGILLEAGYARAEVETDIELADSTSVVAALHVEPGNVFYYDGAAVEGVEGGIADLAVISMDVERGSRFDPSVSREARENLSRLNLFSRIRLRTEVTSPDSLLLIAELAERKHSSVETAVGYWSDVGANARFGWKNRNLFGRGRGTGFSISWSAHRRYGFWSAWYPAVIGARTSGSVRAGYDMLEEDSYEKESPGGAVTLGWNITGRTAAEFEAAVERAVYRINTDESESFTDPDGPVWWVSARIDRDGTDDRLDPAEGTFSWLRIEYGPGGDVSNSGYVLAEGSGTIHVPVGSRIVMALNVHAGGETPVAGSEVLLPDKRFYAGGSTSHRGFRRRKLGPLDSGGLPLGGRFLATGFLELRFPLFWKLRGALFSDWGQVWRTYEDVSLDDIEVAVGPGLRLITPVGPLRFDTGYRVTDRQTGQRKWVFHFAIGYPM